MIYKKAVNMFDIFIQGLFKGYFKNSQETIYSLNYLDVNPGPLQATNTLEQILIHGRIFKT